MKVHRIFRAGAAMALFGALVGAPGLRAQTGESPYSSLFKIRLGLVAGDLRETHYDNKIMGLAAEVKRNVSDIFGIKGALLAEVVLEFSPGRHHDIYPWDTNPIRGNTGSGLNPLYSYDNRKEYGSGINLRLGYAAQMPTFGPQALGSFLKNVEWFAGIGLDRFKVRSEVKYTLNLTPNSNSPIFPNFDGGTFVQEGTSLVPGFFAGLRHQFSKDIGFELSVRNFGMYHYEFTPAAYYTTDSSQFGTGKSSTGTSRGFALEFAITAKL